MWIILYNWQMKSITSPQSVTNE